MLMEEHSEMAVSKANRKTLGLISAFVFASQYTACKAMKSSPLLGRFCGSEFWGFSLLKI